jgi:hypothetical protein
MSQYDRNLEPIELTRLIIGFLLPCLQIKGPPSSSSMCACSIAIKKKRYEDMKNVDAF